MNHKASTATGARAACQQVLELVQQQDWAGVDALTEEACAQYPDTMALVGTRMNALYHLGRVEDAVDVGLLFIRRSPDSDKILRNLCHMMPVCATVAQAHLPYLAKLSCEAGRALHITALVLNRRGVDALRAYRELEQAYPAQQTIPCTEFTNQLSAQNLLSIVEEVTRFGKTRKPPSPAAVATRVELLLKLSSKGQPERFGEARQLAEALLRHAPDEPESWYAVGRVWWEASRMDRALPYLRRFVQARPQHSIRPGVTFNSIYDESLPEDELFRMHCELGQTYARPRPLHPPLAQQTFAPERPLRIGYVSADFGCHPVGSFVVNTLPQHDATVCEAFLYSSRDRVHQDDVISRQIRAAVGDAHWRWVRTLDAEALYAQIRADQIDVLVDLGGYTTGHRMDVFGLRAAAVQVSWLGYPHSTGLSTIDYRISDAITEPEGLAEKWSTEEIYRLPEGFHAISLPEEVPVTLEPPCVRNGYLTFGSFNNVNKIGVETIRVWSALLHEVPDARLVLKHRTMDVFENREGLRSLFAAGGVDPQRIRFLGTTPSHSEHLACYANMDIALDPVGYNGTTTTCEALFMGVPVLTLPGRKHAARVSASLLHQVGLDAWVGDDLKQYLRIGHYAAQHLELLQQRRARLRQDFLKSSLNDGAGLARRLEQAYRTMWQATCRANNQKQTH